MRGYLGKPFFLSKRLPAEGPCVCARAAAAAAVRVCAHAQLATQSQVGCAMGWWGVGVPCFSSCAAANESVNVIKCGKYVRPRPRAVVHLNSVRNELRVLWRVCVSVVRG